VTLRPRRQKRKGDSKVAHEERIILQKDLKGVGKGYGENILNLQTARSYIRKLLENINLADFLRNRHAEIHGELARLWLRKAFKSIIGKTEP
jgi:hypothetical protein